MFYKHWKKIALTLTTFFWASCHYEDAAQPLYGVYCPPEGCEESKIESSSDGAPVSSSSEVAPPSTSSESKTTSSSSISEPPSSSIEQSSSSSKELIAHKVINMMDDMEVIPDSCEPNREGYNPAYMSPYLTAEIASRSKVSKAINSDSVSAESKECLEDIMNNLQQPVMAYGVTSHIVLDVKCSDGSTFYSKVTKRLAERYEITEEEVVKKSEDGDKAYEEGLKKIEQKINNCLDPNRPTSSSAKGGPTSSSSEVTCTPGDSTISYYPPSYSADIAKRGAEEDAKRAGVAHIDSLKENFHAVSRCLNDLRHELSSFIALYGAPNVFPKDEVCSDGTTRLTKEYLDYLQMKEEWEKNKPALDEECQKIYDDKLKEIKQRIDKCLGDSTTTTNLTECDIEVICPDYGIESKCSGNYRCEDGVRCWDQEKDDRLFIKCSDESGKSVTYTEDEFKAKYHATF